MASLKFTVNTQKLNAKMAKILRAHPRLAEKALSDCSQKMLSGAKARAPKDEGTLEASMRADVVKNAKSMAARVYVPVNSAASAYAIKMHEGHYHLGKNSAAKQASSSVVVGRKFLERSITEQKGELVETMAFIIKRGLKNGAD